MVKSGVDGPLSVVAAGENLIKYRLVALLTAASFAGCGGGGLPAGSVVNSPGSGPSSPPTQLVNVKVTVSIPARKTHTRIRSQYVSVNTQSLVIALASVNGNGVSGVNPSTIETGAHAKDCSDTGSTRTCSHTATGSPGSDIFSVTTFSGANGTGSLLSVGTVQANIKGNGGGVRITNTVPLTLYGVIASLQLSVSPSSAKRGKPEKANVTLQAFDATGAQIVGASDYANPVLLQVQGDVQNAFLLRAGGKAASSLRIVRPTSTLTMTYDGYRQASPVTLAATVDGSTIAANAPFSLRGRVPPPPVGTIYTLNYGSTTASGQSATITEYDGSANGNAQPLRTLNLSSKLYARSIAVDSTGNIYVGYFDSPSGASASNGTPDTGNEIAIYSPDASGNASPTAVIGADKTTKTTIFPIYMAFGPSGDLVTYGATTIDGNDGDAVLIYSSPSSAPTAPTNAWAFSQPLLRYPGPTGLALDSSGNFYVNGALHTALGPSYGLFVAPASDYNQPSVNPSRTIPWNTYSKLTPGETTNVAIDTSGEIFIGNSQVTFSGSNPTCQGAANVYSAGPSGSTVPPIRVLTLGSVLTKNYECESPRNPLVAFFPSITLYGTTLFAVDDFNNAIVAYKSSGNGTVEPTLQITGASTGLNAPTAIVVSSLSGQAKASPVLSH